MKTKYNSTTLAFLAAGISVTFVSCYPSGGIVDPLVVPESRQKENIYYVPTAANAPLLDTKNDININIIRSSESKFTGGELQAAYMPSKNVGIMASASFANNEDPVEDYMRCSRFEFGAGYVKNLSPTSHFEAYGGFGGGHINNYHYTGTSRINLFHFFAQPTIGVNNKKKTVMLAFVSKISAVNFNVTDTSFSGASEYYSSAQLTGLYDKPLHFVYEPGLVFRVGWKNFLFNTGYSYSADLTNPDLYRAKGVFSIGVSVRFNTDRQFE